MRAGRRGSIQLQGEEVQGLVLAIPEDVIAEAVVRYGRERDRYLKLAARIADLTSSEIIEKNAIRAQVTSRTKSIRSFEGKLQRFAKNGKKSFATVDDVFAQIGDFSGVRVATYRPEDQKLVADEVCRFFRGEKGGDVVPDPKALIDFDEARFYRAIHCQVCLPDDELVGDYENLRDTSCEIQICSMMAHVWNEIEHDIGYKPSAGGPGVAERGLLESLGYLTRSGDAIITRLLAATEARMEAGTGEFIDVHDMVAQLRTHFPAADLSVNAGQAYDEAKLLGLTSVQVMQKTLGPGALDQAVADERIAAFNAYLEAEEGSRTYLLNSQSADVLIVAMLHVLAAKIEASHPVGRGKGRPPRIFYLARLYQAFQASGSERREGRA